MSIICRSLVLLCLAGAPLSAQRQQAHPRREVLERRLQERLGRAVQQRLGLDAAQMQRLQEVNQRFEGQRRRLLQQERQLRIGLRDEVLADSAANQTRVATMLEQSMRIQRQRLDLLDAEQRELQQFLTPVQRAKYLAMQEQIRRRLEEMRRQRQDGEPAPLKGRPRRPAP